MAREGKQPYFPWYAADWLSDEKMSLAGHTAKGVYIDLLSYAWREGSIPADEAAIAHLLRLTRRTFAPIWERIRDRFEPNSTKTRLVNARMERERERQANYSDVQANRAKRRWTADAVEHTTADERLSARHESGTDSAMLSVAVAVAASSGSKKEKDTATSTTPGTTTTHGAWSLDAVWCEVLHKTAGDTHLWLGIAGRIEKEAALASPSKRADEYAKQLVATMPEFVRWANEQGWSSKPSLTVRAFEKHFERLVEWVSNGGPPKLAVPRNYDGAKPEPAVARPPGVEETERLLNRRRTEEAETRKEYEAAWRGPKP